MDSSGKFPRRWQACALSCLLVSILALAGCDRKIIEDPHPEEPDLGQDPELPAGFPAFITPVENYFDLRISGIPELDSAGYRLLVTGTEHDSASFSVAQLHELEMQERTLTFECIGNGSNGYLLGTAVWKGFSLYGLLDSLGIPEGVKTVKYTCADGYYTYNTLEEVEHAGILGAMYMNGERLIPRYGFPLRIIFPGYYGVRQPGWITEITLLETGPEDFWARSGWGTDSAMAVDSKIFFPQKGDAFAPGDSIRVGGAAYGGGRIASVDLSVDGGANWIPASIIESLDQDHCWVFWEGMVILQETGDYTLHARATAVDGSVQPEYDNRQLDGNNGWPSVNISIVIKE
jgi:DMSO/TMAO reductase YedYZ molybdopterin-dependent catalytic subunit